MRINDQSPVPIYFQIKEDLKQKIISGHYKPNDRIPSEEDLAEHYGTSRMTLRRSVTELVEDGYLYRVHGKGTFVSKPRIERSYAPLTGFMQDMTKRGFIPGAKVLEIKEVQPSPKLRSLLELEKNNTVIKIVRLRYANEEPIVIQNAFIPTFLCPELIHENLEVNSLYDVLENKYKLELFCAKQKMEATVANKNLAETLGVKKGSPLLYVERLTFLKNNIPVEYVEIWYRGDRYVFEVNLFKHWDK
ncbi:MAG: GntR family transcriptional regulator [Bacillota bacterium]